MVSLQIVFTYQNSSFQETYYKVVITICVHVVGKKIDSNSCFLQYESTVTDVIIYP